MCAPSFRVNVLGPEHEALATRFASSGADKFAGGEFSRGADGLPIPPTALVALRCDTVDQAAGGDHTILIARPRISGCGATASPPSAPIGATAISRRGEPLLGKLFGQDV